MTTPSLVLVGSLAVKVRVLEQKICNGVCGRWFQTIWRAACGRAGSRERRGKMFEVPTVSWHWQLLL